MDSKYIKDYERFTPHKFNYLSFLIRYFRNHELRYIYWGRKLSNANNKFTKSIIGLIVRKYRRKYGLEMNFENILGGIRFIHPWNITVNANAVIGENVTLYKGCTIGEIIYGNKKGNPTIGDNVTIYANATICGNVTIGSNTIISSNTFVNFDVPNNSIVIGNPGVIHQNNYKYN